MTTWRELKDNPKAKEMMTSRMTIIRSIREFFWSKDFVEPTTPVAVARPIQEKYLRYMPVSFHNHLGEAHQFFLVTSPEVGMKKLLAAGYEKIFQICQVFRDHEEFGKTHNPEFTMIEWYRSPGSIEEIMDDTEELFKYCAKRISKEKVLVNGNEVDVAGKWERISMKDLWQKVLEVNLDEYLDSASIARLACEMGFKSSENDPYEDSFYKIFLNKIEADLGRSTPTIVYDYPSSMSALCRLKPSDPRYVERFELYAGGLELANAYGELIDQKEQEKRQKDNFVFRKEMGHELAPIDQDFNDAVGNMQPSGGIAIGIDRMVMLLTGAHDINDVILESASDQTERA